MNLTFETTELTTHDEPNLFGQQIAIYAQDARLLATAYVDLKRRKNGKFKIQVCAIVHPSQEHFYQGEKVSKKEYKKASKILKNLVSLNY